MEGSDVRYIKERLFALGYYAPGVAAIRNSTFGNDTAAAVRRFQAQCLDAPGTIGAQTWAAIEAAHPSEPTQENTQGDAATPNIGLTALTAICNDLNNASETRKRMVLDAIQFAFDAEVPKEYPTSFYIRGGNLYGKDGALNIMTKERLAAYFNRTNYAPYFDGGRKEMMLAAAQAAGFTLTGADCSGGVVGLLRHAGVVNAGFDLSADGFNAATNNYPHVERAALRPADILHRTGHVGFYVGGGYAVEWVGGAYGCQLTKVDDRRVYNFLTGKSSRFSAWQHFLSPRYY